MNELATQSAKTSLIATMASKYQMDPGVFKDVIKQTVMPSGATNEQMAAFLLVANQYGLNPVTKEIHAFPAKGGGITPVVGIDGWINLAQRRDEFDGMEYLYLRNESGDLDAITCRVYRKDRSRPIEVTEFMSECRRGTDPWRSHPSRMLRHKATIQAIRYAFGFSGIYDEDDAQMASGHGNVYDAHVTPSDPHTSSIIDAARRMREAAKVLPQPDAEEPPAATDKAPPEVDETESEWPKHNEDGELIDARGVTWDEEVHASTRSCNTDGTWRRRKGVSIGAVEAAERAQREKTAHAHEQPEDPQPAAEEPEPEPTSAPEQQADQKPQGKPAMENGVRPTVVDYYAKRLKAARDKDNPKPNIGIIQREVERSEKLTDQEKRMIADVALDFLSQLDE